VIRIDQSTSVHDSSSVPGAARMATQYANGMGLRETAAGHAALVATELATNLVKHGNGGVILFGTDDAAPHALVIVSADKGRGLTSLTSAIRDGYSTAGSSGTGLGAVNRAGAALEIYGLADRGTILMCRIEEKGARGPTFQAPPRIDVAGISLPVRGEELNGDSWAAVQGRDESTICIADGLGHGPSAATASMAARKVLDERGHLPLDRIMDDMHAELRSTRGAAVGIARIHAAVGRVDFLGVGNIAGTIASDDSVRKTVSLPGIVGHEMRKLQTFSYPWTPSSVLLLQSDGVSASWQAAKYPGLLQRGATIIASALYRDHCRGNDDATIVVARAS
jgi:anti-sigma regulatory factor (Ser/Thr protein kinase)